MESAYRFIKRHGFACLGVGVFTVCAILVFFPALPKFAALLSPDSGPFFSFTYRTDLVEEWLSGAAFTPQSLFWLLFSPLYAHELTYILDSLILALAGVYYLTGRRVIPLAAWTGGLALGLSGYTFTLFCAGHRGYFHMFASAVWAFGLLIRCFETRRLFYFAMLGLVFAWAVPYQPDVLVLVGAVAAAYTIWLTVHSRLETGSGRKGIVANIVSVWPRFMVSAAVLALAGFGGLRSALTTQIANRDAQITGLSEPAAQTGTNPAKRSAKEEHDRWIFATNWSLPPEDTLEFIVPGVFGNDTMQMPYPYWGRLGRPSDEVFQKGRMMPNYRQHTVYLGVVSVIFALFGVLARFAGKKRLKGDSHLSQASADCRLPSADLSDVPFWCGVWAVCFILALGRYTPVYRLFYAVPYMDYIRAPVKFHHLVELATALLAGFGMDAFVRGPSVLRRRLAWLAGGLAVALTLGAGLMLANKASVVSHVASLGLGQVAEALGRYAVQNLMRSVLLAALVGGLAVAALRASERTLMRLGCIVFAALALEQACVARRYVRVINVAPFYNSNAVVAAIKRESRGRLVNVVNYVTPNAWAQDWFSTALSVNGIRNLAPGPDERETPAGKLFTALQSIPVCLWRLCGVEYVMIPRKGSEPLVRVGVLMPVLDFELGQGVVRQVPPAENSLMLARVRGATGLPRFVAGWTGGVAVESQSEAVARDRADVSDAPSPAGAVASADADAGEVRLLAACGQPGVFSTRVRVSAKAPGLLIFNERISDGMEVSVDGQRARLYVADSMWPAVLVPAGEHEMVLRQKRDFGQPLVGAMTALAVLVWGVGGRLRGRRARVFE